MDIVQIIILILGAGSIWASQHHSFTMRKYAPFAGMLGQPFWFYTTWQAEQWGIFILTFAFVYSWWRGIDNYWIRKKIRV